MIQIFTKMLHSGLLSFEAERGPPIAGWDVAANRSLVLHRVRVFVPACMYPVVIMPTVRCCPRCLSAWGCQKRKRP